MSRIKKAAEAIYGWDRALLTFIYPGFDCGSNEWLFTTIMEPDGVGLRRRNNQHPKPFCQFVSFHDSWRESGLILKNQRS